MSCRGHSASSGSTDKIEISFVTLHLCNEEQLSKYSGKRAQRWEAPWLQQSWLSMGFRSWIPDLPPVTPRADVSQAHLQTAVSTWEFSKLWLHNRILYERSIQFKFHFLTNSPGPNQSHQVSMVVSSLPLLPSLVLLVGVILRSWEMLRGKVSHDQMARPSFLVLGGGGERREVQDGDTGDSPVAAVAAEQKAERFPSTSIHSPWWSALKLPLGMHASQLVLAKISLHSA